MKSRIPFALVAALIPGVVLALACEDSGAQPEPLRTQVRDGADIRIVENASPPEGSRLDWRIGPEPAVLIGEVLQHGEVSATRDGSVLAVLRPENADTIVVELRDAEGGTTASFGTHPNWEPQASPGMSDAQVESMQRVEGEMGVGRVGVWGVGR